VYSAPSWSPSRLMFVNAQLTASMNWLSELAEYSHLIKWGIAHGHTVFFSKPG
jgi:hypothetical protein